VPSYDSLKKVLEDKLAEYNETNAVMDLVLFQQALEHVTRISRIIDQPRCACWQGCWGGLHRAGAALLQFLCGGWLSLAVLTNPLLRARRHA
jgi:dynein heavy chain